MKYNVKNLLRISLVFFFMGAAFTNCGKEEETSEEIGTATIKGKVEANLNAENDTDDAGNPVAPILEDVPSGTTIHGWISTEDLVTRSSNTRTYERRYFEADVDSDGRYELTVDANNKAVDVTIEPDDFEVEDYVNAAGDEERRSYSAMDRTVTIRKGQTAIEDIDYN